MTEPQHKRAYTQRLDARNIKCAFCDLCSVQLVEGERYIHYWTDLNTTQLHTTTRYHVDCAYKLYMVWVQLISTTPAMQFVRVGIKSNPNVKISANKQA